ncbi:RadC family protein [Luminiphilus sp. nBUS_16]|uniref:RadC family protein n=1 Tax=Luminiphilus sp. nBUS_16 TaxID=3395315 RepID=UPI003EBF4373
MDTFSIALLCDRSKSGCSGSDAKLLAAALGLPSATAELEIAGYLYRHGGSLREGIAALLRSDPAVHGVGSRRRHQLGSALLLAQRLAQERLFTRTSLQNPASCYDYLQHHYQLQHREVFTCFFLNTQRQLLACRDLFLGTLNTAPVYPREIAAMALKLSASGIIVAHNHPSGSVAPSSADLRLTERLRCALELLDIELLDHLIVGQGDYLSMASEGIAGFR